jgi:hypothetical protein
MSSEFFLITFAIVGAGFALTTWVLYQAERERRRRIRITNDLFEQRRADYLATGVYTPLRADIQARSDLWLALADDPDRLYLFSRLPAWENDTTIFPTPKENQYVA